MSELFVISYDEAPKSLNAGGTGSRAHWSKGYQEKKKWEGLFGMLLLHRKIPRGMTHVTADVLLEFKHRNRRDAENYRSSVSKPLADCLVAGGWLPDDTAEFFEIGAFKIESGVDLGLPLVKSRITISLRPEYEPHNATQVLP